MSGQGSPGRYNRSVGGLVGSMVVLVAVVVAFVVFRGLVSNDPVSVQTPIDYVQTVHDLQREGVDPVYPAALPPGWTAFNVTYVASDQGAPPQFGLALHTPEQHYVGYEQSQQPVAQLLATYVDDAPRPGQPLSTPGALATSWDSWTGGDGDHAFTARVGAQNVIVFGSAPVADVETVVRSLSTARITTGDPGGVTSSPTSG